MKLCLYKTYQDEGTATAPVAFPISEKLGGELVSYEDYLHLGPSGDQSYLPLGMAWYTHGSPENPKLLLTRKVQAWLRNGTVSQSKTTSPPRGTAG